MAIDVSTFAGAKVLHNPGKQSLQIVSLQTAPDAQATITRVTMEPGAVSARHSHPRSEQIWIVEAGEAALLSDANGTRPIRAGDVVRTPPGTVHGIENTGNGRFVYLTVTVPPEDMQPFYAGRLGH